MMLFKAVGLLTGKRPSLVRLARYIGANRTTVHRWRIEETIPSYKNYDRKIEVLANFYRDYLQLIEVTSQTIDNLSNG
jgi:hypothetical protein